ncbi:MAG: two-component regulator propeller domain-containing protein [Saprospiraceae bacterium]
MRSFNINDGLVSNQVRGFYQDKNGFIWVMTWEGLSRYDGYAFRNYTLAEGLSHPLINDMIEGSDGRIIIAENDGTVDVIVKGEIQPSLRKKYDKSINRLTRQNDGRIFASIDHSGVLLFNEDSLTVLNKTNDLFSVTDVLLDGNYLFVCGDKSGVMLEDHTFINVWPHSHFPYSGILKENDDRIWVGTLDGLRWVNLNGNQDNKYSLQLTPFDNTPWGRWIINDIMKSIDGSIWIAALGGLIQVRADYTWRVYNRSDGLPNDNITTVFEDKAGFIWIGTDQGMAQLDTRNTIDIFTISEDLPNTIVTDIQPRQDGSAYILASLPYVNKIKVGEHIQSIPLGSFGNAYRFLKEELDTIVSTTKGYYIISEKSASIWNEIPYTLMSGSILVNGSLYSTLNGKITIATSKESFSDTSFHDQIYAMVPDPEGGIWLACLNKGLYKIKIKKNAKGAKLLEWKDYNEYLPEKTLRSLHRDQKGNLWVGTRYSGLIQLTKKVDDDHFTTHVFGRTEGFISDFIKSVDSDDDGNVWVGTNAGIEKLIPEGGGYRVFSFSRVHNFFAAVQQIVVGPDHTLWCATTSGVIRVRDSSYDTIVPPAVYIASVSTAKSTLKDPQLLLPLDLNYNQNYIDIEFSSNDFINGKKIEYSYRLKGSQDTTWSKPLPVHNISYANLLPGDYRFEVKVKGWNGVFGDVVFYKFRIRPPFWQQAWFIALVIIGILGLVFSFYRYRIRQLQRIQDVRNRIASDLHDEIGSSLTHVNILSEIGRKTFDKEDQPQQLFKRIGEEVQSSSEALDDIIWSVSSRVDTAEDLISRMRRYASELFDAKGITFILQVEHLDENQSIGLELRRDFYLVYKEALRNIIRHAEANKVDIHILREDQFLSLVVTDNGHGFDTTLSTERHGLKSIKGRVAKWKGRISIESSAQTGTIIKIGLPLKKNI